MPYPLGRGDPILSMPSTAHRYTVEEVLAFPEDGNRGLGTVPSVALPLDAARLSLPAMLRHSCTDEYPTHGLYSIV